MSEREPRDFYADLAETLGDLGAAWALAGALAVQHYTAKQRFTTDADLLVTWNEGLIAAIEERGWQVRVYADPGDTPHLIRAKRGEDSVDLLVALTDYQRESLRRAPDHVLTPEDLIVHKLIAWRARDRVDIRSIIEAGHQVDWGYVRRWADAFGLVERVDQLDIN